MAFHKKNRSAFLNYLRAKYEMYTRAIDVDSYPYFLGVDPSDVCQLRCTTCPTGIENEGRRQKGEQAPRFRSRRSVLAPELFDSLLRELGDCLFWINFYNYGEPLLNKHLPEFLRKAKEFDIFTVIHTNLSLPLSDERIEAIMASGLDHLSASVDGFSQETYQVHRVGGDLALVKSNLERLAAARNRMRARTEITYSLLVFSFNEHEVAAARDYCNRLGIDFETRDAFIDEPGWLPSHRRNEKPQAIPERARIRKEITESWAPLPAVSETSSPPACGWHYGYSVVTAGGPVAPCCAVAREEYDFGTVIPGRVSFADVWNGDLIRKSRADFAGRRLVGLEHVETVCTRCPYPKTIHHLYSVRDAFVLTRYYEIFRDSDPVLAKAFDLLSNLRYRTPLETLFHHGDPDPRGHLFVGRESENDTAAFVEYFERNLLSTSAS